LTDGGKIRYFSTSEVDAVIIEVTVRKCPKCSSENIVKNGHDYKGAQKYYCRDCHSYGTLDKKTITMLEPNNKPPMPTSSA